MLGVTTQAAYPGLLSQFSPDKGDCEWDPAADTQRKQGCRIISGIMKRSPRPLDLTLRCIGRCGRRAGHLVNHCLPR